MLNLFAVQLQTLQWWQRAPQPATDDCIVPESKAMVCGAIQFEARIGCSDPGKPLGTLFGNLSDGGSDVCSADCNE